ncbi:MAG: PepSY-associated TM helix domain-containing protein [Hyphomicrobiaceae bacterium]
MKIWLLRLHRWLALAFALPLVVILGTAIVLSVEPAVVTSAIKPGALTADRLEALIARHDPQGRQRAVAHRSYDGTISLGGRGSAKVVDVATGELRAGPSSLASLFVTARRLHETLLMDLGWLVLWSTYAMLVLALLGVLMGWPRFANTVSGWHKGMAWGLLPLLVLSPLTGVFLAQGINFAASGGSGGGGRQQAQPRSL